MIYFCISIKLLICGGSFYCCDGFIGVREYLYCGEVGEEFLVKLNICKFCLFMIRFIDIVIVEKFG